MMEKVNADEKVREGWLRLWMAFEALGAKEDKTKEALEELIGKLDKDARIKLYKKEFTKPEFVQNPHPIIKEGYSITCEAEMVINNFDNAVHIIMEYGPSAVEILEPNKLNLGIGEAQSILNLISEMMHRFAAAGIGGIVIAGKKE